MYKYGGGEESKCTGTWFYACTLWNTHIPCMCFYCVHVLNNYEGGCIRCSIEKNILSQLSLGCIIYYTSTHQIHSFVNFKDKKDEMSILVGVTDC